MHQPILQPLPLLRVYSPFGVVLEGRSWNAERVYRYGFNAQEKDDEIRGNGNSIEFKFRGHDPRLGRFFVVDPLASDYHWNSPYAFAENKPIETIDLEGAESSWDHHAARMYSTSEGALTMNNAHKENKKVILATCALGLGQTAVYVWGVRAVAIYLAEEAAEEICGHPIIPDPGDAIQAQIKRQYASAPTPSTEGSIWKRVSWKQSEKDVLEANPSFTKQESFKGGDRAKYGTEGSSRPDGFDFNTNTSLEVKNYDLTKKGGESKLATNIYTQINERVDNLPKGAFQRIVIDLRGQKLNDLNGTKANLEKRIKDGAKTDQYSIEYLEDK
jgi:RHS repeat-associated protein